MRRSRRVGGGTVQVSQRPSSKGRGDRRGEAHLNQWQEGGFEGKEHGQWSGNPLIYR
jgi:hypothetical protein